MTKLIVIACLAWALVIGCNRATSPQETKKNAEIQQFHMVGKVVALDSKGRMATIDHKDIPGFMEAMTMGYEVKDPAEFSKLSVGEPITATVYVQGDDMWIGDIKQDSEAAKP